MQLCLGPRNAACGAPGNTVCMSANELQQQEHQLLQGQVRRLPVLQHLGQEDGWFLEIMARMFRLVPVSRLPRRSPIT